MSCTLYWRPLPKGKPIGNFQLRNAIEDEYGMPAILGASDVGFLRGLLRAGVEGAQEAIDLIEQLGAVEFYKEC